MTTPNNLETNNPFRVTNKGRIIHAITRINDLFSPEMTESMMLILQT